jgi:hypothetical protein
MSHSGCAYDPTSVVGRSMDSLPGRLAGAADRDPILLRPSLSGKSARPQPHNES